MDHIHNNCSVCSNDDKLIALHSRCNAEHYICSDCFNNWYILKNNNYNCVVCRDLINIQALPEDEQNKIKIKDSMIINNNINLHQEQEIIRRRYFKLNYNNKYIGKYYGKMPKQAASKAYSFLIKKLGLLESSNYNFTIREYTKNSKLKIFNYSGSRIKLDNAITVGSRQYNFINQIYRV